MKCPCCGSEMVMDAHTKIDKFMCYDCGYVEGRPVPVKANTANSAHHNFNFGKLTKLFDRTVA